MPSKPKLRLCYVKPPWAYFTSKPLAEQTGDDWNDAPYDCNAGEPYDYAMRVAYAAELVTPAEQNWQNNCPYSVDMINAGAASWLISPSWAKDQHVVIPAGTTLAEFSALVQRTGGTVYYPKPTKPLARQETTT